MKPSDVQDDLVPGIVARREAGRRTTGPRLVAAHAVEVLGQVKARIGRAALHRDPCRAGGDHQWRAVEKPAQERGEWPPGPWQKCDGCHLYQRVKP